MHVLFLRSIALSRLKLDGNLRVVEEIGALEDNAERPFSYLLPDAVVDALYTHTERVSQTASSSQPGGFRRVSLTTTLLLLDAMPAASAAAATAGFLAAWKATAADSGWATEFACPGARVVSAVGKPGGSV
ncbi:hypothetical protein KC347_g239 [Hortaea werneckii]|nr:hypothetical protein KC347_g239 [Hortaea werneckii]